MKKDIKLVVCDIDNTLVVKHQPLTERTRCVIQKLREQGVLFGLASGRPLKQLHTLEENWNMCFDMIIGMNGSELYDGIDDTEETYYSLKKEWIQECFDIMEPFETNPSIVKNGTYYVGKMNQSIMNSQKYANKNSRAIVVENYSDFWKEDAMKIGFRVSEEIMPEIEKRVAQFPSENYVGFKTESTMFEFCHAKASKGDILNKFCMRHEIDLSKVWAFGDMTNDISLLETAGVGVCMANGSLDCKEVADIITDKGVEEEGFADFCEKHIL